MYIRKPVYGEHYWTVRLKGGVCETRAEVWTGDDIDLSTHAQGLAFQTQEEALALAEDVNRVIAKRMKNIVKD